LFLRNTFNHFKFFLIFIYEDGFDEFLYRYVYLTLIIISVILSL